MGSFRSVLFFFLFFFIDIPSCVFFASFRGLEMVVYMFHD